VSEQPSAAPNLTLRLADEPRSVRVTRIKETGQVFLSDVPEDLLSSLLQRFGAPALKSMLERGPDEQRFHAALPKAAAKPPRFLALAQSGELAARAQGAELRPAPYFMAAINRSDELALGRTGVLYFACRKGCHFCQYRGFPERELDVRGLADRFLLLEREGADNVQWLSPTAYHRLLVQALSLAASDGFHSRIVHKSEGEDPASDLALLDGLVDVYMPDAKFVSPKSAEKIGLTAQYGDRLGVALRTMFAQVGPLTLDPNTGVAHRGVLVRHLLMPGGVEDLEDVVQLVASIDRALPLHVLTSYSPVGEATKRPGIDRRITEDEERRARAVVERSGLTHAFVGL
jgi:putative pyruvate formate lyase activating enzyme